MQPEKEKLISAGVLERLSIPELVEIFNEINPPKNRIKEKDVTSTYEIVEKILQRLVFKMRQPPSVREWWRNPKTLWKANWKTIDIPPRMPDPTRHRSKLRFLIIMCLTSGPHGIKPARLVRALGVKFTSVRSLLKKINQQYGYGFKENEKGYIRVVK